VSAEESALSERLLRFVVNYNSQRRTRSKHPNILSAGSALTEVLPVQGNLSYLRSLGAPKRRFLHLVFLCRVHRLLVTASVVPSSPILVILMKESLTSTETSVLTRATRRNISQDAILQAILYFNQLSPSRYLFWTP
jgi:hypothetical protein